MVKTRKVGRPALSSNGKPLALLHASIFQEQLNDIDELAQLFGLSRGEVVRKLLAKATQSKDKKL